MGCWDGSIWIKILSSRRLIKSLNFPPQTLIRIVIRFGLDCMRENLCIRPFIINIYLSRRSIKWLGMERIGNHVEWRLHRGCVPFFGDFPHMLYFIASIFFLKIYIVVVLFKLKLLVIYFKNAREKRIWPTYYKIKLMLWMLWKDKKKKCD